MATSDYVARTQVRIPGHREPAEPKEVRGMDDELEALTANKTICDDGTMSVVQALNDNSQRSTPSVDPESHVAKTRSAKVASDSTYSAPDPPSHFTLSKYATSSVPVRLITLAVLFGLLAPTMRRISASSNIVQLGVRARSILPPENKVAPDFETIPKRQSSGLDVCKRWAGQSALINGTLFYYGGRSTEEVDQTSNTWNNNFIAIDLTKSWQIASPSLTNLPTPSGAPAVSLGYLWSSNEALFLYGGQFSDSPVTSPVPFALWSYNIRAKAWTEHSSPTFEGGQLVQRAAEGAGVSIPNLGRGYYFGGHLDGYTTPGWSQSTPRVYLQSLVEYTMPGFGNTTLQSSTPVGSDGQYRNITAESAGFPERADGTLVYVPGYGESGIVLGLAGGTNQSFTQMNVIDVYDIAESKWYKQATSGRTPEIRVNPCTVALSAADGSSTQIYMFGGQNLIPYGQQKQYDDLWILTVPSFTWIQVNMDNQSVPPARAGHTCNVWNGQMVVVGGYVGQDLACDSPGIYVFNTSSLKWQTGYTALDGGDPLNKQPAQKDDPNALQGSYQYQVPGAVQSVIGGNAAGAATITAPAQTAAQGPVATGKPITYTVTNSDGSVNTGSASPGSGNKSNNSSRAGVIAAGVIAGILFVMALYLAFCAWLYRKQRNLYRRHVAMAQVAELSRESRSFIPFGAGGRYSDKHRSSTSTGDMSSDQRNGSGTGRANQLGSNNPYVNVPGGAGYATAASSTEDLMQGHEPSLLGIMLNPRRSLRVVNKD